MRRAVFGLLCLLLSSPPAAADDWLKALALFDAGRYQEALELAAPFAEAGNVVALEMLYASYTYGYGAPVDHAKALIWLRKGSGRGEAAFQDAMGHHYYEGVGVELDHTEALRWFHLAAAQGHAPAIYSLAIMTMNGQGTESDAEEGWRLMQRAAELDNPDALFAMASLAMNNAAMTGSIDTAMQYLLRAAALGHRQASAMLGVLFEELPDDPDHRMKAAYHYAVAAAAGCTDVKNLAARARAVLSAKELAALEYNLGLRPQPKVAPRDPQPMPAQCLAG